MKYFFCIDGGETKSIATLYDSDGKILSKSKSGSGNSFNDVHNVEKNIILLWSNCCKKAKLNKNKIQLHTIASFGLAGIKLDKSRKYLKRKINFFKKLILSSDGFIALAGTSITKSVAILNIGTGVVAHLIVNNYSQQLSGWGFPYGDKGGGWWIGFRLVQETLKSKDEYVKKDSLTKKVLQILGGEDSKILTSLSNLKPNKLAELTQVFFNHKKKSKIFKSIMKEGVSEIEEIIKYMIDEKKINKIYFTGGLSKSYLPFIKKKYLNHIICNQTDPLYGAFLIAKGKFPYEKSKNK